MYKKLTNLYILLVFLYCFFIESLPDIISETASSCQEFSKQMKGDMEKEVWRKYLNLCELYILCSLNISFLYNNFLKLRLLCYTTFIYTLLN